MALSFEYSNAVRFVPDGTGSISCPFLNSAVQFVPGGTGSINCSFLALDTASVADRASNKIFFPSSGICLIGQGVSGHRGLVE